MTLIFQLLKAWTIDVELMKVDLVCERLCTESTRTGLEHQGNDYKLSADGTNESDETAMRKRRTVW